MSRSERARLSGEGRETIGLSGVPVLVLGGGGDLGRTLVSELQLAKAWPILGTRSTARYKAASAHFARPFIVDVNDSESLAAAFNNLGDLNVGMHVVYAAAGGMEPFLRELASQLIGLRRLDGGARRESLAKLQESIPNWVKEAEHSGAARVNHEGLVNTINALSPYTSPRAPIWFVFCSSLWSTFSDRFRVPSFYRGVAESKKRSEDYLTAHSTPLRQRGVHVAIVSGSLLRDTTTARFLELTTKIMPASQREDIQGVLANLPLKADFAKAVMDLLQHHPSTYPSKERPVRLYVPRRGVITSDERDCTQDLELELPF